MIYVRVCKHFSSLTLARNIKITPIQFWYFEPLRSAGQIKSPLEFSRVVENSGVPWYSNTWFWFGIRRCLSIHLDSQIVCKQSLKGWTLQVGSYSKSIAEDGDDGLYTLKGESSKCEGEEGGKFPRKSVGILCRFSKKMRHNVYHVSKK